MKIKKILRCLMFFVIVVTLSYTVVYGTLGEGFDEDLIVEQDLTGDQSKIETTANGIAGSIIQIVRILAVAGIVIMGVRYMFSSADKKADIKTESISLIIGLTIVFATSLVVDFIVDSAEQVL